MSRESPRPFVSAIVLAAGESRRMGDRNKLLLPLRGTTMIRRVVESVSHNGAGEVVVVLGHQGERIRAALGGLDVVFAENPHYADGMSTSIHAGVGAAALAADAYMICLSDLPLIEPDEYRRLIDAFGEAYREDDRAIVLPVFEGQRGNPVVLSAAYAPAILAHQGVVGCRSIVRDHPDHVTRVEMETDHVLHDVDTPGEYGALPPFTSGEL